MIEPGLDAVDLGGEHEAVIREAVTANVQWTLKQLGEMFEGQDAKDATRVVGAIYELERGEVRLLA